MHAVPNYPVLAETAAGVPTFQRYLSMLPGVWMTLLEEKDNKMWGMITYLALNYMVGYL